MAKTRDPKTGKLRASKLFPEGMKAFSAKVQKRGFRFGLYTSQTSKTCAGRPGGYGHEKLDVETYCDWNVDYVSSQKRYRSFCGPSPRFSASQLKIDYCKGEKYAELNTSWTKFRDAIDECACRRNRGQAGQPSN